MSDEKWLKYYNRNVSYENNLDRLAKEFQRIWLENRPSPISSLEKDYKQISVLGAGAFGVVKLCKHKRTEHYYAVKVLVKDFIFREKQVDHVKFEKRILAAVCFPFLVYLEFSFKDNGCLYLGLPFINGGELFAYQQKVRKFSERQAKFYAAQVFLAIEYLHHLNIVYRDLKTENILIDYNGYLRITDFGFCKKIEGRTWTLCGTPEYLAPEIIKSKPYGKSVDWWSFGVLCYEFMAGHTPFRSGDTMVMYEKICAGRYSTPSNFTKELKVFISSFLQVDVTRRFGTLKNGTKDIRELDWFKDTNWKALLSREIDPIYVPKVSSEMDANNYNYYPDRYLGISDFDKYPELFADF